jgi:hypothetical protein
LDRWQRGESMSSIGRGFDRGSSSIYPLLSRTGGIRPAERKRSRLALTIAEPKAKYHRHHIRRFNIYIFSKSIQIVKGDIANAQGNDRINQKIINLHRGKGCKDKGNTVPNSECSDVFNNIFELCEEKDNSKYKCQMVITR